MDLGEIGTGVLAGMFWLRIRTSVELLWMRYWTFSFHTMLGVCSMAALPVASRVVFSSTKLDIVNQSFIRSSAVCLKHKLVLDTSWRKWILTLHWVDSAERHGTLGAVTRLPVLHVASHVVQYNSSHFPLCSWYPKPSLCESWIQFIWKCLKWVITGQQKWFNFNHVRAFGNNCENSWPYRVKCRYTLQNWFISDIRPSVWDSRLNDFVV
jgi:hypothetical protein